MNQSSKFGVRRPKMGLHALSLSSASMIALTVGLAATGAATAQTQPAATSAAPDSQIETIVVTAEKRSERAQDVPFGLSVMTGSNLTQQGAEGFDTLQGKVAGLQILGIGEEATQFSMRGVITDRQGRTPQTAALYIDDVPVGISAFNPNFQQFDLDRVEVLKGPQGTLFGAGAESGAVRLVVAKPDLDQFEWGGGAEVSDTTHGGANGLVYGIVNAPIIDDELGIRALGYWRDWSGYINNVALGINGTNSENIEGGRFSVTYKPSDRLTITAMAMYQNLSGPDSDWDNYALPHWEQADTVRQRISSQNGLYDVNINYNLGFASLTSVTSYQNTSEFLQDDATNYVVLLGAAPGQFPQAALPSNFYQRGYTQELRLASPDSSPIKWIGGVYWSHITYGVFQSFFVPGFEAAVPGDPPASAFGLPTDDLGNFLQRFGTRQIAVFGDGTVPITDNLNFSAGLRWYNYEQDGLVDYNGLLEGEHDVFAGTPSASGVNPRFNLSYKPDTNNMLYAQVARGFRVGGLSDPAPQAFCGTDLAAIGLSSAPTGYGPDHLWNYEAGWKSTLDNNRITLDADAFYIDWTNIQATKRLACGYAIVVNGGNVTSKGVEFEGSAVIFPGLTVSANAAYTDSTLSQLSPAGTFGTAVGQRSPYTPRWTYDASIDYTTAISGDYALFGALDYSYTGQRYTDFDPATAFSMPAFATLNVKLGVEEGPWQAFLFADNITNAYGVLDLTERGAAYPPYESASTTRPRTFGLRINRSVE